MTKHKVFIRLNSAIVSWYRYELTRESVNNPPICPGRIGRYWAGSELPLWFGMRACQSKERISGEKYSKTPSGEDVEGIVLLAVMLSADFLGVLNEDIVGKVVYMDLEK